jgi:hypothetical protein
MLKGLILRAGVTALLLLTFVSTTALCETQPETSRSIYRDYSRFLVQVRILESGSGATAAFGSGFFAGPNGQIATNYHVVASAVDDPASYRLEVVGEDKQIKSARLLAVDVVNDLAILQIGEHSTDYLKISNETPSKGQRLYSLGNPMDFGFSIIEGTYNGLLEHSHRDRIHFTGGINSGMSGGPAILPNGRVAGVNVATGGNSLSVLVPAVYLQRIVHRVLGSDFAPPDDFMVSVRDQLDGFQRSFFESILSSKQSTVRLGPFEVPTRLADYFYCHGNHKEEVRYELYWHRCWSDDLIYVTNDIQARPVLIKHVLLESDEIDTGPFYTLYTQSFDHNFDARGGEEKDYIEHSCEVGFVLSNDIPFKTVLCLRRKKNLPDLYDVTFKAAVLGNETLGLHTRIDLSSISFENALRMSQRHLEGIRWAE